MTSEFNPLTRRAAIASSALVLSTLAGAEQATAQARPDAPAAAPVPTGGPLPGDRVILTNEDSNTLSVIDPVRNEVAATVNLTSFDEDPRPPFRFVTGGVMPTHDAMIQKPLYHGAISIHGCVPSPDGALLATAGRGSSNLYFVDARTLKVMGNQPNPRANAQTNPEIVTSGVLLGREPHEPTFTRNGSEVWVALRGEDRLAVIDVAAGLRESAGEIARGGAVRGFVPTIPGPSMVWFSADGALAVVASQKVPQVDILDVRIDGEGRSTARRRVTLDIAGRDRFAFTPFLRLSPEGSEMWLSHKLADALSVFVIDAAAPDRLRGADLIPLGDRARPNHVEFVRNARGNVAYASFARVDDDGPAGVAASRIAIIDRAAPPGQRRVVGTFLSHGREAHGIWSDPGGTRLYIAHELDEMPGTPNAGQTVCTCFDVADPFRPRFITQIPLGELTLPSGRLRNKKSINLVYVRPGARSATG
jgi:YVTN family beta-propeller protein